MAPYATTSIAALNHVLPMGTEFPTTTTANHATAVRLAEAPHAAFQLHERNHTPVVVPTLPVHHQVDPRGCRKYCNFHHLWPAWYREAHRPHIPPCECPDDPLHVNTVDNHIQHKKRATADDVDTSVDDQAAADAEAEDGKVAPDITEKPYADTAATAAAAATADAASTKCKPGDWDCTCREYCDKGDTGTFPIYRAANSSGGDAWTSTTIYCVDCCAMNVTDEAVPQWLAREARAVPGHETLSAWAYLGRLFREYGFGRG